MRSEVKEHLCSPVHFLRNAEFRGVMRVCRGVGVCDCVIAQ